MYIFVIRRNLHLQTVPAGIPAGITLSVYRFRFTASVIISSTVVIMREFAW